MAQMFLRKMAKEKGIKPDYFSTMVNGQSGFHRTVDEH